MTSAAEKIACAGGSVTQLIDSKDCHGISKQDRKDAVCVFDLSVE
jgi:hypothetical protein